MLYVKLSDASADTHCWCLNPKHHLFVHVSAAVKTNPALLWNYSDEDEIGRAVKICTARSNGQHIHRCLLPWYRMQCQQYLQTEKTKETQHK